MKKIESFTVNHLKLHPGIYVSRKDQVGDQVLTTFDLRITRPNFEPVMNTAEVHAIEHLGATFLRNHEEWADRVIYFGPMGCRTGFYMILAGDLTSPDVLDLVKELFTFVKKFSGDIPGAHARDCGNSLDMSLPMAKYYARKYLSVLRKITNEELFYPQD